MDGIDFGNNIFNANYSNLNNLRKVKGDVINQDENIDNWLEHKIALSKQGK